MISAHIADVVCMAFAFGGPIFWVFRLRSLILGVLLAAVTCYFSFLLDILLLQTLAPEREGIGDLLFFYFGWAPVVGYTFFLAAIRLFMERFKQSASPHASSERRPLAESDERTLFLRDLVGLASSIVTYDVGLPVGCLRLHKIFIWLRPYESLDYPVVAEYLDAIRDLTVGPERLDWDRDTLREHDQRLEAIHQMFRDRIFDVCYDIIQRYATPSAQSKVNA